MKKIWDSENHEQLYAVNEEALHRSVNRKSRRFNRLVVFFEAQVIVVGAGLGALYLRTPILQAQQYERLISGGILLAVAAYFLAGSVRRRRREAAFDQSLLGDIDKALWQVRNHVSRVRGLGWSLIAPMSAAVAIDWLFPLGVGRQMWPFFFLLLMALSVWGMEYEIRCWYLPRERKLEGLRRVLTEGEQ